MATNQKLGIHWIVTDPDGIVVEDYEDWESWPNTDPDKTHEFISPGRFDLNKPGPWTIGVSLAMNRASPVQVASYAGVLCTVAAPPATFHLSILVPSWAAGGYVDPGSGDYPANTTVKLTAHPLSGYQFTGWGRDASGTALTYNLYMNSDKNVEAYFEKVPVPPPPECFEGATRCVGYDLHECIGGKWVLIESNSRQCGYTPPPECFEGATRCVGYDLHECIGGKWVLIESNSPQCGYTPPPECWEGATRCVGYDLHECIGGKWVLIESNSLQCR